MTHKAFAQIAKSHESYTFQTTYFDLPEQPLHQCLMEFAIQSKLSIIVRRDMLMGLRSRPIVGPYSPQSALSQILARSPLSFRIQGKAIVIEQRHAAMDKLPPVKTNQRQIPDEEVIVKSQVLPYRYNTISQTQFYGGMSSFDLARFVSVIPNQLLLDQASEDVGEALKNSSAVTPGDGQADTNDDFYVRGFRRYGIHIDGFRLSTTVGVKQLPETIERIEVLKGPSTLFFGQSEPGGIVNIVRKKPTLKSHKILNMVAGTDAKQHLALDVNSAIPGSQNTALFRFIGARETRDRFRNLTEIERDLIAPSFTWSPTQETTFELGYEAQKTRQTLQQGTVLLAPIGSDGQQNIIALDAAPRLAQPEYTAKYQLYNIGVRQQFSEHWAVKGQYFHHSHHNQGVRSNRDTLLTSGILLDEDDLNPTTVPIIVGGIVIPINTGTDITNPVDPDNFKATVLSLFDEEQREDSQTLRFRLDGKNLFDQLNYTISLGADWYTQEKNDRFVLEERSDIISLTQLDPSQSQIDAIVAGVFNDADEQGELTSRQQILQFDEYGAFIFNSVNISQQWQVSLGGRYTLTQAQVAPNNSTDFIELQKYREFSADGGIRFEPFEDIAIYVNYSEGIKANY